ncbi:Calcineurin-like phosphoesterase [Lachnospiraceae bacterium G11]|nr:Calcineurin-like phosphoesterase [Lachnospiraceae bacterium G11]
MSKVFVIPDVHLKPWIFDKAEELLFQNDYDQIVCLGDLVDDWGQEKNLGLYTETFKAIEKFINRHPNFLFCYGNHDVSYLWAARESGYSDYARMVVLEGISRLEKLIPFENIAFIHRIDNVLFSHAGLTEVFVSHFLPKFSGDIDEMLNKINSFGREEMWSDVSPIWARPQDGWTKMYPVGYLQVVGHTPVNKTDYFGELVTVDDFSTYRNGDTIGDQRFIWVDTVKKRWGFADRDGEFEDIPDEKLDIRNYRVGDWVRIRIRSSESEKEEILEGTIEIIDKYPSGHASIDVMSGNTLYKHLSLKNVIEKTSWKVKGGSQGDSMNSILIKDTTREERERIVAESIGNISGACDGCMAGLADMYQDYIDGKKEIKDINMEFRASYESGIETPERENCGFQS